MDFGKLAPVLMLIFAVLWMAPPAEAAPWPCEPIKYYKCENLGGFCFAASSWCEPKSVFPPCDCFDGTFPGCTKEEVCGLPTYKGVCNSGMCQQVPGDPADSECDFAFQCETHAACVNGMCIQVDGPGPDTCNTLDPNSCTSSTCAGSFCQVNNFPGPNECGPLNSCDTPPFAMFDANPQNGPAPLIVTFTDQSFDPDGDPINGWEWRFGTAACADAFTQGPHQCGYANQGLYTARLRVRAGGVWSGWTSRVITVGPPIVNDPPIVDAGPDDAVEMPNAASLDGTVSDDGLPDPPGAVFTLWTKQSGPGSVNFANASAVDTSVLFDQAGVYVLRLTADDGALTAFDEVTITVTPENNPPVPSFIASPVIGVAELLVSFDGSASSDPDPGDSIATYEWFFGDGQTFGPTPDATVDHEYAFLEGSDPACPGALAARLEVCDTRGACTLSAPVCVQPAADTSIVSLSVTDVGVGEEPEATLACTKNNIPFSLVTKDNELVQVFSQSFGAGGPPMCGVAPVTVKINDPDSSVMNEQGVFQVEAALLASGCNRCDKREFFTVHAASDTEIEAPEIHPLLVLAVLGAVLLMLRR